MSTNGYYAEIVMKAAKRAAYKVIERANLEKRPIPIWKDGKVVHEIPPMPNDESFSDDSSENKDN